jgi:hypothetical protein
VHCEVQSVGPVAAFYRFFAAKKFRNKTIMIIMAIRASGFILIQAYRLILRTVMRGEEENQK